MKPLYQYIIEKILISKDSKFSKINCKGYNESLLDCCPKSIVELQDVLTKYFKLNKKPKFDYKNDEVWYHEYSNYHISKFYVKFYINIKDVYDIKRKLKVGIVDDNVYFQYTTNYARGRWSDTPIIGLNISDKENSYYKLGENLKDFLYNVYNLVEEKYKNECKEFLLFWGIKI